MNLLLQNKIKFFIGTLVLVLSFVVVPFFASAQFNKEINYQGKLADSSGVAVADGTYNMRFWLLDSDSVATTSALWSEERIGGDQVQVTNGLFSVMLGEVSSLAGVDFNQTLYLGVEIGGTGSPAWDGEMSPRKIIGTVPSAFVAETANTLSGLATSSFLRSDQIDTMEATSSSPLLTLIQNGVGSLLSIFSGATEMFTILNNGNVGIASSTPSSKLSVVGDTYLDGNLSVTGNATILGALRDSTNASGTTGQILSSTGTGTAWTSTSTLGLGDGTFTGLSDVSLSSLTANRLIFASSTGTSLTDSANLTFDGTNLGLAGTTGILLGGDVLLSRGAANRLDLATGGSLNLVSGAVQIGGTTVITSGSLVRANSGSAGSPSLSFSTNTNTGFFRQGTNAIGFSTGGTERVRLTNNDLDVRSGGIAFGGTRMFIVTGGAFENIRIGSNSGNTSGSYNVAIGTNSALFNSGGNNNFIGYNSGMTNTGIYNNVMGYGAGQNNTGSQNNIFGWWAGFSNEGSYVNLLGVSAGYSNTGSQNNFLGRSAGYSNTGSQNNFLGQNSGYLNTGDFNEMIGYETGRNLQATSSVIIGGQAFRGGSGTTAFQAINNVALGYRAGYNAQTGSDGNILLGYQAAQNLTTGANNIVIGYDVDIASTTGSNQLNIGNLIFGTGIDGTGSTISSGNIGIGTTTPSSKLTIIGDTYIGGDLTLTGALRDSTNASGTVGQILSSTGIGTEWLSTSSLGLGDGTILGLSDTNLSSLITGDLLMYDGANWINRATSTLAISLADTTGILSVLRGGTGASAFTAGHLLFGNGTNALATSSNLFWNTATNRLGIGTTTPETALSVVGDITAETISATAGTSTFAGISLVDGCFQDTEGSCVGMGRESTYVVAAPNSRHKHLADFVTNGTADEVEINAAIQAAYANGRGGKVYLLEGDYIMSTGAGDKIVLASSTSLIGSGPSTRIHVASSTNANANVISANNVVFSTISDLLIDGNQSNQSSGSRKGVDFVTTSSSTIRNIVVQNISDSAIRLYSNSNSNLVIDSKIKTGAVGIELRSNSNFNSVKNNKLEGAGAQYGLFIWQNIQHTTFSDNVITNFNDGVNGDNLHNNIFSGNIIKDNNNYGILFWNSNDITISGNVISGNTKDGIWIPGQRNIITGNTISNNLESGVYLYGSNSIVSTNSFYDNGGSDSYSSIYVAFGSNNSVTNNRIIDTAGTGYAIYVVTDVQNTVIANNVYSGTGASSIFDDGTDTRYNQWDRTNITTDTTRGYDLFTIHGSSSSSTAKITQLGSGDIFSLNNSGGNVLTVLNGGNIGIGSSTPSHKLTIVGDTYIGGDLTLTGALRDSTNASGTVGQILSSTGVGTEWLSTSSLGLGDGTLLGLSDTNLSSLVTGDLLMYDGGDWVNRATSTLAISLADTTGILSVLRGGTGVSSLTANKILVGNGTGNVLQPTNLHWDNTNSRLGIGTASPGFKIELSGTTLPDQKLGINNMQMLYLPNQGFGTGQFNGSLFVGNGGQSLSNTSGNQGRFNTGVGIDALLSNTIGFYNTALGRSALRLNTIGFYNTAIGVESLSSNTGGSNNTAVGRRALGWNTDGSNNTALGVDALLSNTIGSNNTAFGYETGRNLQAVSSVIIGGEAFRGGSGATAFQAINNVALGYRAGYNAQTGSDGNILLGYQAAQNITTGANNIIIGYNVDIASTTGSNQLNIGNLIFGTGIDGTGTTLSSGNIGIGTTTPSSKLTVIGDSYVSNQLLFNHLNKDSGVIFPGDNYLAHSSWKEMKDATGILLPMYVYPADIYTNSSYNEVIDLKKRFHNVPLYVILNPSNGPGEVVDGNYTAAIKRLRAAGAIILGYISTDYTISVSVEDAKADVDSWRILYPEIDGIFMDEMTNTASTTAQDYYTELTRYIHGKGFYPSIGNPGAGTVGEYFASSTADVIVIHETSNYPSESTLKGDYSNGYADFNYNKRAGLVYGVDELDIASTTLLKKYLGMIYVTDDVLPNPWDTVSPYLEELFEFLSVENRRFFTDLYIDGNVGIGTTTPSSKLTIIGDTYIGGDLTLTGALRDSTNASGTVGQILSSTGTGTAWTSTSTLGLGDGTFTGLSDVSLSSLTANRLIFANSGGTALTDSSNLTFNGTDLGLAGSTGILFGGDVRLFRGAANRLDLASGDSLNIPSGSAYKYNNVDVIRAQTSIGNYFFGSAGNLTATGLYNTGTGASALSSLTNGWYNVANGTNALFSNTGGTFNTAIGYDSLALNTIGSNNTSIGYNSLRSNTGNSNTASGYRSLSFNTTGSNNTAYGTDSLLSNTIGSFNAALGHNAGSLIASGSGNASTSNSVFLGSGTRSLNSGDTNQIVIGYNAIGNGSNSVTLGNTDITKTILQGNVGIGTTSPLARLAIERLGFADAGVAGLDQYFSFVNNTESAVQFANRSHIYATNTATTTMVGSLIRVEDSTLFGNIVRGFEVQTDRGTNTLGENTAISGFARTFGVRGVTEGDAGGLYEPAGIFAETRGSTQGNAIRGYSSTVTTASLFKLFQDTSDFEGTGLLMNFGNAGGSFSSTTSKFIDLQNAGSSMFTVGAYGMTTIGDGTTSQNAGLQIGYGGLCVDNDGTCNASTTGRISAVDYHTGNSDLAEMYFSSESLKTGEVVYIKGGLSVGKAGLENKDKVIGVVSTKPGLLLGFDDTSLRANEKGFPIALSGRVPVRLSNENGPIKAGDELMLSSVPGVVMKATSTGHIVGIALEDFNENRAYSDTYINQFGDDIADPVFTPINKNDDPRIHDGCYFSGGRASGEEECVPLIATTTDAQIREAEALAKAQAQAQALANLVHVPSSRVTLDDGKRVKVGQIVMFVDLRYRYLDEDSMQMVASLMAVAETQGEVIGETIWQRLVNLANNFIDGVLSVFTLKADRVEVKNELCVDGVCVNADDLRKLLDKNDDTDNPPIIDDSPHGPSSGNDETGEESEEESESEGNEEELIEESEEGIQDNNQDNESPPIIEQEEELIEENNTDEGGGGNESEGGSGSEGGGEVESSTPDPTTESPPLTNSDE